MLKIPLTNPYFAHEYYSSTWNKLLYLYQTGSAVYDQGGERMQLVYANFDPSSQTWDGNMLPDKWYLFTEAFSLHLKKK